MDINKQIKENKKKKATNPERELVKKSLDFLISFLEVGMLQNEKAKAVRELKFDLAKELYEKECSIKEKSPSINELKELRKKLG
jgi:hypothetical protein